MVDNPPPDFSKPLKLSPLSRLYFTLEYDLRKSAKVFDERRFDRLVSKHNEMVEQRNNLFRNTLICDVVVVLLLFGKSITVPGFGVSLADIPAAREAATIASGLAFQFAMYAFLNWLGYVAIIETINRHRNEAVDHDIVSAAEKNIEFIEKLYRSKMNTYGPDYVIPGKSFVVVSRFVVWLGVGSILAILFLHFAIAGFSVATTFRELGHSTFAYLFCFAVVASNLAGLLTIITQHIPFKFYLPKS